MNLREALFLSSISKATYAYDVSSSPSVYLKYLMQTEIIVEDIVVPTPSGLIQSIRETYVITVTRTKDKKVFPQQYTHTEHSLSDFVEYLQLWGVDTEHGWHPDEVWDESVVEQEPA
jgi:hypothetical protein